MGKRILITSIPSWNQKIGSNTFSSLFSTFDSTDLANIYIQGDLPDVKVCSRYFHIEESSVIRSIFYPCIKTGQEVKVETNHQTSGGSNHRRIKRHRLLLWARELAWKSGRWKSRELNEFLHDFNPEVLVFPIEDYPYFNRLNQYIIDYCKPEKVIGYFWDDNFSYKQHPYSLVFKIERFFRRFRIRNLVRQCTDILAISPKMKRECDEQFSIDSVVLTKPILKNSSFTDYEVRFPIKVLYTGKLIIGRAKTISKIVSAIRDINKGEMKLFLDIYTQTVLSKKEREKICIDGCCELHAPVPQSRVIELQEQADILLFAESLSNKDLTARLSFSTKLTDYFAAGKCIWAVGNAELGPIDYIKTENAGFVSTNENEIYAVLDEITKDPNIVSQRAAFAFECGRRNHSKEMVMKKLNEIINSPVWGGVKY